MLVVLALVGCGPRFETPAAAPTARSAQRDATATHAPGSIKGLPAARPCRFTKQGPAPMTGGPFDELARPHRPLLAIKIENSPMAHPHTGLEVADVVVEHVVEGGITRFTAMYHSCVPDVAGPVRSARPVDPQFLPAYEPLLAYSGARPEVVEAMQRVGLATLRDGYAPGFFRLASRQSPHNLYAKPAVLYRAGKGRAPAAGAPGWTFSQVPTRGRPVAGATVRMSARDRATWTYDEDDGVYRRAQNGRAHRVTGGGRIGPANVVVMRVKITDGGCCDTSGARYADIDVMGSGPVQVMRDGVLIKGTWRKAKRHHRLKLYDRDGQRLPLKPGRTWIMLAPRRRRARTCEMAVTVPAAVPACGSSLRGTSRKGPSCQPWAILPSVITVRCSRDDSVSLTTSLLGCSSRTRASSTSSATAGSARPLCCGSSPSGSRLRDGATCSSTAGLWG